MPQAEAEIFQHYRVLRRADGSLWKLGAGVMGVTYKAIDTNLDAPVALKVINTQFTGSDDARERFWREARAAASLCHRNIASIYHIGQDGDTLFCAMEFIDGETVEHFIKREGPQSWRLALPAVLQVTHALMAAHRKHLVHRDIKPANVMLVREVGEDDLMVKLIDFGLAKTLVEDNGGVVNLSSCGFLGTPLYASPEQCEEVVPDIRSDIYSLGVTLWFMLAGRPPFEGGSGKVLSQHFHAPPPWDQLPAAVPEPVRALLARMLATDRADRPQTPADLRRDLGACLRACFPGVPAATSPDIVAASASFPVPAPTVQHENVQFTAYRPKAIRPGRWEKLLVFAHLDQRPDWMDADDRSPFEEVEAQAAAVLGPKLDAYRHTTDDSRWAIPRNEEITLVPELPGFEFNPTRRSFFWKDGAAVLGESFEMRASATLEGQTARGRVTIFLGVLILAEINLAIRVDGGQPMQPVTRVGSEKSVATHFRRIFASYSHRDSQIVELLEHHARSLGDEFLRDRVHLRSGEAWESRLRTMVDEADVFQLFWSPNAARSRFVEQEWRYALQLGRTAFIRPTYWQEPMPPPPKPLEKIHFFRLSLHPSARLPPTAAPAVWRPEPDHEGYLLAPASPVPQPRASKGVLLAFPGAVIICLLSAVIYFLGRPTPPSAGRPGDYAITAQRPAQEIPPAVAATPEQLPAAAPDEAATERPSANLVGLPLRRVLEMQEQTLGKEHPDTLISLSRLAQALDNDGDLAAAEPLYIRAEAGMAHVLGPDQPERLNLDYCFSVMRQKQGRLTEALSLAEHAAAGAARTLSANSPVRLKYEKNVANLRARLASPAAVP